MLRQWVVGGNSTEGGRGNKGPIRMAVCVLIPPVRSFGFGYIGRRSILDFDFLTS